MGQFATPTALATEIVRYARESFPDDENVRFLDPAFGTGSFYSALLKAFPPKTLREAVGFEIDPHYGLPAGDFWKKSPLKLRMEDFTRADPESETDRFNLLVCNPPYVRHHHIAGSEKDRLKKAVRAVCGVEIGGLAGLYCYFLAISHAWLQRNGLAGWLVPSEFMDVNYGTAIKRYLLNDVTLVHVHRFAPSDLQFGDALVSSAVVWFRNHEPAAEHEVRFSYGGSLLEPRLERMVSLENLQSESKWTRYPMKTASRNSQEPVLSDFFQIKRGLATGNNRFFILSEEELDLRDLPIEAFQPILPSPRYLSEDEIQADEEGIPQLKNRLFLLDCKVEEREVKNHYPTLWKYLEEGKSMGVHKRYLCRHRRPWYSQENRPPVEILCTYIGRSDNENERPFRFILNGSRATAANVYLMLYPRGAIGTAMREDPGLTRRVWTFLNGLCPKVMLGEGRVYGGGLHKLEPRELGNVPVGGIGELLPQLPVPRRGRQARVFDTASMQPK